ncbi:KRAB [Lepeophtheirus salmonis]|uniref:KRAB n=1 Tax=Lepeophtheirus salmonis TaxID=72036 RepID=A0A7R8CZV0_LEPSM|nr:KRAB [Lepeophtheirus salmonis]CAF2978921.1 KRAB [Lepeophtheirus salmonis]
MAASLTFLSVFRMGSLSDIHDSLVSRYSSLESCESIQKNDGSSFLLIRPSINKLSGYLPKLYVVVELETVKLLSYHGKVLKEEKLDGGHILDRINEGKLFMCLGIGNQTLNDSLLKDVYSEPSKREGEIAFRSRQCSFFLENTPGLCNECQSLLTTLYSIEDNFDNDTLDYDWSLSELKEEEDTFNGQLYDSQRMCLNDTEDNETKSELQEKPFNKDNMTFNKCFKCLETFNNISLLNSHEQHCLKDTEFIEKYEISLSATCSIECTICLQKFTRKGSFIRHSNLHVERMNLNEVIHCPLCGQSLDNRRLLNAHIHESHDASTGCCGICFEIISNEHLSRHFEKRHNYNPKKHLCPECGQKFKFPGELQCHTAYAHDLGGEKSVVCDQCGKVLPHRKALTKHIRRSHDHDKTRTYACQKCDRVFFENYRLKKHLSIHTGLKPFKCSRCEYCCVRKDNVFIHLRRVHKILPTSNDVIIITDQIISSESIISQKTESVA